MTYQFDEILDRRSSHAVKIDGMKDLWGRTDLIPLWVADMDFPTPDFILDAVRHRLEHPLLGYTAKSDEYYRAVERWVNRCYDMGVERCHINFVPGIVAGLGMAINCFSKPGDRVMIMPPVYPPFMWLNTRNHRIVEECPLIPCDGTYRMNLDYLRAHAEGVRLLILCNPHNPGGVVWTVDELRELAEICREHHILVLSDEIHADLTLPPCRHTPFATVSEAARDNSVTFMAPSKTFNMPGLAASHTLIFNDDLRREFVTYLEAGELNAGHVFAFDCVAAAYNNGEEWLEQCLAYIADNIDLVVGFLETHTPRIRAMRPQASFLVWLDCRGMEMTHDELIRFFADEAGLALNDGESFGKGGEGCMRLNVATPRAVLRKALSQLEAAYKKHF